MNLARPLHASQSALQAWLLQGEPTRAYNAQTAGLKLDPKQLADLTGDPMGAVVCDAMVGTAKAEVCGNDVDEDCNGAIDNGLTSCQTALRCPPAAGAAVPR